MNYSFPIPHLHSLSRHTILLLVATQMITCLSAQEGGTPAAGAPAVAPAASFVPTRMIAMRPDEKRPLTLKSDERNPYAKRNLEVAENSDATVNAEEQQIRERLGSLRVTGKSQGPKGIIILLGDIILEQGRVLPQLLEDQGESLKVLEINEDSVVLGWLDIETSKPTGKTMQVAYDLSPSVSYALHGQSAGPTGGGEIAEIRMGILRVDRDRRKKEAGMASRNPAPEIPREAYEAGQ
jgi:hypothetical protein